LTTLDVRWLSLFADVPAVSIDAASRFWATATGWAAGEPSGDDGEFLPFEPADGDRYLWLQRVARPAGSGGWHLDVHVPDRFAGVDAATAAGADVVRAGTDHVALASPSGLPFCLADDDGRERTRPAAPSGHGLVDQLCIDIPAPVFEEECEFWARMTGWARTGSDLAEFDRLDVPLALPVRILLQRLGIDDTGGVRAHADIAAGGNRFTEVERHEELGAKLLGPGNGWTTLRDPAGLLYCITDRAPGSG
jgi:catechol 2,3-dioxygenase-like lactoylglutathione lyase family enzyme